MSKDPYPPKLYLHYASTLARNYFMIIKTFSAKMCLFRVKMDAFIECGGDVADFSVCKIPILIQKQ